MTVQHFTLSESLPSVRCTYLAELTFGDDTVSDSAPDQYTVSNSNLPMYFTLFHGRFSPTENMDTWGFGGPTFNCLTVAHDQNRILLQDADAHSLELAKRLGLEVTRDTITLHYFADLVVVPRFTGESPAYFGDHSAYSQ